jgi:hypothetical protein
MWHVVEQRRATLRRVEMELDEADEMVCCFYESIVKNPFADHGMIGSSNGDRNSRHAAVYQG